MRTFKAVIYESIVQALTEGKKRIYSLTENMVQKYVIKTGLEL